MKDARLSNARTKVNEMSKYAKLDLDPLYNFLNVIVQARRSVRA